MIPYHPAVPRAIHSFREKNPEPVFRDIRRIPPGMRRFYFTSCANRYSVWFAGFPQVQYPFWSGPAYSGYSRVADQSHQPVPRTKGYRSTASVNA